MKQKQALVTLRDAAARKGCSTATIYRRARRGQIEVTKLDGRSAVDWKVFEALEFPEHVWLRRERKKNGKNGKGRK